jgi:hypothetical protein
MATIWYSLQKAPTRRALARLPRRLSTCHKGWKAMSEAEHSSTLNRLIGFLAFLSLAVLPALTCAEPLTQCQRGLQVLDGLGNPIGQVVGDRDGSCLVKSRDGRLQRWVPVGELSAAPPEKATGAKKTVEPKSSEREPTPANSDEIENPDEIDTAGLQSEWLQGFSTRSHHRPHAARSPALRRDRLRHSRENVFFRVPAPIAVPAARFHR